MTTEAPTSKPKRAGRVWRGTRRLFLVLACILVSAYLVYWVWMEVVASQGRAELATVIAETDAAYPGWRWDDLMAARKSIPDEENAWPVVVEMCDRAGELHPRHQVEGEQPWVDAEAPNRSLPADSLTWLQRRFDGVTVCLALIEELAKRPRGQLPDSLLLNPDLTGPLDGLKARFPDSLMALVMLRSVLETSLVAGDSPNAVACIRAGLRIGAVHRDDPNYQGYYVWTSGRERQVMSAERWLGMTEPDDGLLAELQQAFEAERRENILPNMVRGERAQWFRFIDNLRTQPAAFAARVHEMMSKDQRNWLLARPIIQHQTFLVAWQESRMLRWLNEAEAVARKPLSEQHAQWERLDTKVSSELHQENNFPPHFNGRIGQRILNIKIRFNHDQTQLACGVTSLACERFRLAKKRWPKSLDELVPKYLPEVPREANGQPLTLRVLPDGIRIESSIETGLGLSKTELLGFRLWDPDHRRLPAMVPAEPGKEDQP